MKVRIWVTLDVPDDYSGPNPLHVELSPLDSAEFLKAMVEANDGTPPVTSETPPTVPILGVIRAD